MPNAIKGFLMSRENGLFINSYFSHCQPERQDTWFIDDSPEIRNKSSLFFVKAQVSTETPYFLAKTSMQSEF